MEQQELKEIERRTLKYWNVDGLPELLMGSLWVLWGGLWLAGTALPKGPAYVAFWLVVPFVLASSGIFSRWAVQKLKERITYPRAGYVLTKQPRWVGVIVALASLLALAALVFGLVRGSESTLPPLLVAIVSLGLFILAVHESNERLLILAVISLGLGVWVWRTNAGWAGLNWTFLWLGLAALVTGALRLRRFLRENPKAAETEA